MAVLFPILQFFDNKGDVLSGGTLTFYKANTSELGVVYTNQGGGTPLENPVQLNTSGRPTTSGSIWLNGAYRLSIKDSNGVLIYSADNILGFNTVDWTGLTATLSQINSLIVDTTDVGNVRPSKVVTVSASKDVTLFNNLSSATFIANTAVKTPIIKDSNSQTAITLTSVPSQINALTVTPAVTTATPSISATGSDTDIDLILNSKGTTGQIRLNGYKLPLNDGTDGYLVRTDGSGSLTFSVRMLRNIVKQSLGLWNAPAAGNYASSAFYTTFGYYYLYPIIMSSSIGAIKTISVTPSLSTNKLLIRANAVLYANSTSAAGMFLVESTTSDPVTDPTSVVRAATYAKPVASTGYASTDLHAVLTANSVSTRYYSIYCMGETDVIYQNGSNSAAIFGGTCASSITCREILV